MTDAVVWDRRVSHLNKRNLELVDRQNGNGFVLDSSWIMTSVRWRNSTSWLIPRKPNTPQLMRSFSSCTET